jgi:molecular chaperone DnaK
VRDTLESEDVSEIKAKTDALQEAFHKVSEQMYAQAAQAQSGGATNGAGSDGAAADSGDEEVIDAEVVDEGKAS